MRTLVFDYPVIPILRWALAFDGDDRVRRHLWGYRDGRQRLDEGIRRGHVINAGRYSGICRNFELIGIALQRVLTDVEHIAREFHKTGDPMDNATARLIAAVLRRAHEDHAPHEG